METQLLQKKILKQIKLSLKRTKMSQRTLASNCNLKESTLCRYLSGSRKIDIDNLINICNYLKISLDETLNLSPKYSNEFLNKILNKKED